MKRFINWVNNPKNKSINCFTIIYKIYYFFSLYMKIIVKFFNIFFLRQNTIYYVIVISFICCSVFINVSNIFYINSNVYNSILGYYYVYFFLFISYLFIYYIITILLITFNKDNGFYRKRNYHYKHTCYNKKNNKYKFTHKTYRNYSTMNSKSSKNKIKFNYVRSIVNKRILCKVDFIAFGDENYILSLKSTIIRNWEIFDKTLNNQIIKFRVLMVDDERINTKSIGTGILHIANTTDNYKRFADLIIKWISDKSNEYNNSGIGENVFIYWTSFLEEEITNKILETEDQSTVIKAFSNQTKALISKEIPIPKIVTISKLTNYFKGVNPIGEVIDKVINVYKYTISDDIVVHVKNRSENNSNGIIRPRWKIHTLYSIYDFELQQPGLSWLEIHSTKEVKRFIRIVNNVIEVGRKDSVQFYEIQKSVLIKQQIRIGKNRSIRYGTFDIETININNVNVPYCAVIKTRGKKAKDPDFIQSFYLSDYNNPNHIIQHLIFHMCSFDKTYWYAHNIGSFDGVLILNTLCDIHYEIKPTWAGDVLTEIIVRDKNKKRTIHIKDTIKLLPGKLDDIGKSFNIVQSKGNFPHDFATIENLNYIGKDPNNKGRNDLWNFKEEAIKYCTNDTEILYEIITKFRNNIWYDWKIDISRINTISSLAMKIFLSSFYNINNTPIYHTGISNEDILRMAYYGGTNLKFIDRIDNGYIYDIVSQYPNAIMRDIPSGKPVFTDNIENLENFFGFIYCEVTCPDRSVLKNPILPRRIKVDNIERIVIGTGTWKGWYFSEELKYAKEIGYIITPISGFRFNRGVDIFKKYIDHFFIIKIQSTDAKRILAKLILNSLYGRWGINRRSSVIILVKKEEYNNLKKVHNLISSINDTYDLIAVDEPVRNEIKNLISKSGLMNEDQEKDLYSIEDTWKPNSTAVQLSAAISSYARISINKYINITDNVIAYIDTDSVVVQNKLPDNEVGEDLGIIKLEHTINEGLFIRPKFYGIKNNKGEILIKCSSIDSSHITWKDIESCIKGNKYDTVQTNLVADWKTISVKTVKKNVEIDGKSIFDR